MQQSSRLSMLNTAAIFAIIFITVYILHIGKALLLPFVIALVFWYIIIRVTQNLQKIPFGASRLPYSVALIMALIVTGAILYIFFLLLTYSISNIINEAPTYQAKVQQILAYLSKSIGHKVDFSQLLHKLNLSSIFSTIALMVSSTASNFVLILIYLLFLLLEHRTFDKKLSAICNTSKRFNKLHNILQRIDQDIYVYLKAKTLINMIAGILSYICLKIFGINYAEFWAVLIFLLHYIPFIGAIAAVVFVLIAASIQITNLLIYIILAIIISAIQFSVGNVLEPRWMGTRLNLSPIVILISLAFWGALWGIFGMFLCVPLMVIINIILANFPATRSIAILLSAGGNID